MILSVKEIADTIGCRSASYRMISTLLTDSRSLCIPDETLFFALRTNVNDGHRYVAELYRRGVIAFVVESVPEIMGDVADAEFLVV